MPKVFNEGKSPQKMIEMEDNRKGIEENTLVVMQSGDRMKQKLEAIGVRGNGRLNNMMVGGLQAMTKEIQRTEKEEKEKDIGGFHSRGEKDRKNVELNMEKPEKKRSLINYGHYRWRRVKWTKRSTSWNWKRTTPMRKIVDQRMKHRSREKFFGYQMVGKMN